MADRNGYIGRAPGDSAVTVARQTFSPTGVTTDFTFASGYTSGYFDVFINGVKMIEGSDYTSTDGSTFSILNGGAINGDVIEGVAYKAFNAATATVGINSSGTPIGSVNTLNFVGTGNTFALRGSSIDISISGGGAGAGGTWANYDSNVGVSTTKKVKIENNLEVTGVTTSTGGFVGNVTGNASGTAGGLTGTPDITVRNITGVAATFTGVLTYEDVTNVDSVGIVTARSGFEIGASGVGGTITSVGNAEFVGFVTAKSGLRVPGGTGTSNRVELGNSQEFTVQYNTSSNKGLISAASNSIDIQATTVRLLPNAGENGVIANQNGSVDLYHDNVLKLSTAGAGVTVAGITSATAFAGYDYLRAPFSSRVDFTVTVASKTAAHRYNGTGSGNAYLIDGVQAPFLTLTPGRTYRFVHDNTGSHPLKFYLEADKTTLYSTGVTFDNAYTEIVVSDSTPQVLHYQCTNHGYMGNAVNTNSNVAATQSAGITTQAGTASGIVTSVFLSDAVDHKITATGICTITSTQAGTEGESHTIRIVNSGIATVGFSTYFLFPSGSAPSIPTADGAISLISFTVHDSVGAGCTQLLAGASVNFS